MLLEIICKKILHFGKKCIQSLLINLQKEPAEERLLGKSSKDQSLEKPYY